MPFQLATKEIGYVKSSFYGPPGTGKTTILAMILMYLSKTYHNSAPVAWLSSEKGVDFVLDMFKAEGVPLKVSRSRSFVDLRSATRDAREAGCCAVGVDSITHFWQELFTEGMKAKGPRLTKIMRIKEEWQPFSQDFQDSPLHFLVTGRLGFEWEDMEVQNEQTGEITREVSRGGSKIKAEGSFGHEPDLEIEMSAVEDPDFMRWQSVTSRIDYLRAILRRGCTVPGCVITSCRNGVTSRFGPYSHEQSNCGCGNWICRPRARLMCEACCICSWNLPCGVGRWKFRGIPLTLS